MDEKINQKAREVALNIQSLMAIVEFQHNRHEPCLVCKQKFKHHIDGLPCDSDKERKRIYRKNRWGNIKEIW